MAPSKGLPGCVWHCNFTQPWPWRPLKILGTFKSRMVSLCDSGRPTGQISDLKAVEGLTAISHFLYPFHFLCSWHPGQHISFILWSPGKLSPTVSRLDAPSVLPSVPSPFLWSVPRAPLSVIIAAPESVVRNGQWAKAGQSSYMRYIVETEDELFKNAATPLLSPGPGLFQEDGCPVCRAVCSLADET